MAAAAENWVRTRGAVKVHLMVRETDAPVATLCQRLGFEIMPRMAMPKWLSQQGLPARRAASTAIDLNGSRAPPASASFRKARRPIRRLERSHGPGS